MTASLGYKMGTITQHGHLYLRGWKKNKCFVGSNLIYEETEQLQ